MPDVVQFVRGSSTTTPTRAAYVGPRGQFVVDTDTWSVYVHDGTTAGGHLIGGTASFPSTVAEGGTGLTTLTAHGVLLGEGTSNVAFATVGTANRVLADQGSGADPAFVTLVSILNAVFGTTRGRILFCNGTNWTFLAPGTDGYFLQTHSTTGDPTWAAAGAATGDPATLDVVSTGTTHTVSITTVVTQVVWRSATAGAKTTNIPASASGNIGYQLSVKLTRNNGDAHTITPASGTIEGAASFTLTDSNDNVSFVSDGANTDWVLV